MCGVGRVVRGTQGAMVKFGVQLTANRVKEWQDEYIAYEYVVSVHVRTHALLPLGRTGLLHADLDPSRRCWLTLRVIRRLKKLIKSSVSALAVPSDSRATNAPGPRQRALANGTLANRASHSRYAAAGFVSVLRLALRRAVRVHLPPCALIEQPIYLPDRAYFTTCAYHR